VVQSGAHSPLLKLEKIIINNLLNTKEDYPMVHSNYLGINASFCHPDSPLKIRFDDVSVATFRATPSAALLRLIAQTVIGGENGGLSTVLSLLTDQLRNELKYFDDYLNIPVFGVLSSLSPTTVSQGAWWEQFVPVRESGRFIADPSECTIGSRASAAILRWACLTANFSVFSYVRHTAPKIIFITEAVSLAGYCDDLSFSKAVGRTMCWWDQSEETSMILQYDWCRARGREFALASIASFEQAVVNRMWKCAAQRCWLFFYI
jgi:hypothetical protein